MRTKLALVAGLAILSFAVFTSPASAQYPPATTTTAATADTTTTTEVEVAPAEGAPADDGTLARTGSDVGRFVAVGGVLVLVGAFVLVSSKRRRHPIA